MLSRDSQFGRLRRGFNEFLTLGLLEYFSYVRDYGPVIFSLSDDALLDRGLILILCGLAVFHLEGGR